MPVLRAEQRLALAKMLVFGRLDHVSCLEDSQLQAQKGVLASSKLLGPVAATLALALALALSCASPSARPWELVASEAAFRRLSCRGFFAFSSSRCLRFFSLLRADLNFAASLSAWRTAGLPPAKAE